jgi:hypothetical protein
VSIRGGVQVFSSLYLLGVWCATFLHSSVYAMGTTLIHIGIVQNQHY